MTYIFAAMGVVVLLIQAYFLFGGIVADWLDSECDKMERHIIGERLARKRFFLLGLHSEARYHAENIELLNRNIRACKRVAGWLK